VYCSRPDDAHWANPDSHFHRSQEGTQKAGRARHSNERKDCTNAQDVDKSAHSPIAAACLLQWCNRRIFTLFI
ncbi:hypothetical protein PMAYCL1PPCAC_20265, partial [Pristionchus mayeri]